MENNSNDKDNKDNIIDRSTIVEDEGSPPQPPPKATTAVADLATLHNRQEENIDDEDNDESRHTHRHSFSSEDYFLDQPQEASVETRTRSFATGSSSKWEQYDGGGYNAASAWCPNYEYPNRNAVPWWGYHPNNSSHQNHYYYQGRHGPSLPTESIYEQRPPTNWQHPPSSYQGGGDVLIEEPRAIRPETVAAFRPPRPAKRPSRDAETPTRSNRGGGGIDSSQPGYQPQRYYHHNAHHYPPYAEIERQYSWDDWDHGQPQLPRLDYKIAPPSLQYLHHHHRETDLLDHVSRSKSSSSQYRRSSSPDAVSGPPPHPVYHKEDDSDNFRNMDTVPRENRKSLPATAVAAAAARHAKTTGPVSTPANDSSPAVLQQDFPIQGLGPYDVLCGRGIKADNQYGNAYLRKLVLQKQVIYLASVRSQKASIAMEIMEKVREKGGRFLKKIKVRKYEQRDGEVWEEMGEKQIYDKICQSLREGAPQIRQKMMEMSQRNITINSTSCSNRDKENAENYHTRV